MHPLKIELTQVSFRVFGTFNKTRTSLYVSCSNAQASLSELIRAPGSIISEVPLKTSSFIIFKQEISNSRRQYQVSTYDKGTGPPPGSEYGSSLRGTQDKRITRVMSCPGEACWEWAIPVDLSAQVIPRVRWRNRAIRGKLLGKKYSSIEFLQTPGRPPASRFPLGDAPGHPRKHFGSSPSDHPLPPRNGKLLIREPFHTSEYGRV